MSASRNSGGYVYYTGWEEYVPMSFEQFFCPATAIAVAVAFWWLNERRKKWDVVPEPEQVPSCPECGKDFPLDVYECKHCGFVRADMPDDNASFGDTGERFPDEALIGEPMKVRPIDEPLDYSMESPDMLLVRYIDPREAERVVKHLEGLGFDVAVHSSIEFGQPIELHVPRVTHAAAAEALRGLNAQR